MDYRDIVFERRGAGAWIVFNRPERMNPITPELIREMDSALSEAEADPDVRAVVVTGTGNAFCAGAELKNAKSLVEGGSSGIVDDFLVPVSLLLRRLRAFPKPVIAAVNGYCMAGGLETVLCCDLVVAAESAVFSDAHARYGLLPAVGGAQGLARTVGPFKAKEMLFTADRFTARDMLAAGLVNRVVPDAELQRATQALVDTLAARSPAGLRRMKQMVNDGIEVPWDVAARLELLMAEVHTRSDDVREGLAAFAEKRQPKFRGR